MSALVVTGGSRGIGAAVAVLAAKSGWDVAVNYTRDKAAADKVVAAVQAEGRKAAAIKGDMAVENDVIGLFEAAQALLGRIGGVVNNAGITGETPGKLADASAAMIARVIDLNVTGALLVAREAARAMSTARGGKGGAVVNLSSAAATLGSPNEFVWYASSKGAIDTLTIGLARELATEGVRVNAVTPGLIETEIHASSGQPDRVERMMSMIPMARAGSADEVAEAVVWLLSDAASYVTGANIRVSGGR